MSLEVDTCFDVTGSDGCVFVPSQCGGLPIYDAHELPVGPEESATQGSGCEGAGVGAPRLLYVFCHRRAEDCHGCAWLQAAREAMSGRGERKNQHIAGTPEYYSGLLHRHRLVASVDNLHGKALRMADHKEVLEDRSTRGEGETVASDQ